MVKDMLKFYHVYDNKTVTEKMVKRSRLREDGSYASTATASTERSDTPSTDKVTSGSSYSSWKNWYRAGECIGKGKM